MLAGSESKSATPEIMILAKVEERHKRGFSGHLYALKMAKLFSNLLDARKQQLETSVCISDFICMCKHYST